MEQWSRPHLDQLITFYWVGRCRSFSDAARRLALPRSTVSQQIRSLESRLGARLLERTTRKTVLTQVGDSLLGHCERIVAELEEAKSLAMLHRAKPQGLLRVGVPVTFSRFFLAPLIPSFCKQYPEICLEFILSRGNTDLLGEGLDASILVGAPPDSTHIIRKLGQFDRGLFASHAYLKSFSVPGRPQDLTTHKGISMNRSPKGSTWKLTGLRGESEEIAFQPRVAVSDPVLAQSLAASGVGIAVVPLFLATKNRRLVRVLPDWSLPSVEVFALYPSRNSVTPKLRVFLEALESQLNLPVGPAGRR